MAYKDRPAPLKEYYCFFAFDSPQSGRYVVVKGRNREEAKGLFAKYYGLNKLGCIEADGERARIKAKAYGFTEYK